MRILDMQAAYGRLRGDTLRLEPGLNVIFDLVVPVETSPQRRREITAGITDVYKRQLIVALVSRYLTN